MKFTNVVALCKGFYTARPGDVPEMWKDFSHCIQVDGYVCCTKSSVAEYCMNKLEDFAKEFPDEAWKVSFGTIFREIQNYKSRWKIGQHYRELPELDDCDLIIWVFRDFIRYLDGDKFTEGVIPNDKVLPMDFECISDTLWKSITSKYTTQDTSTYYFSSYEQREENITNYKY